ncbi:helix-turn-helix domain-containing protein [Streptomyces sp. NPDC005279]|uniref:helix-turn-helix domain-containing protein n=1 Tax=Streptomyces sp. NPDC005279 TaxID=3364712 RepID=UPI0036CE8AB1
MFTGVRPDDDEHGRTPSCPWRKRVGEAELARLRAQLRNTFAESGLTKKQLCARTGLSRTTIHEALSPRSRRCPSLTTVAALAKAMGVPRDQRRQMLDDLQPEPPTTFEASCREAAEEPRTRDFFQDLIEKHTSLFAGRQDESARIMEFVRDRASGYVFVEALSGYGKTSLLADLVRQNPDFRYHFISQAYRRSGGGFDPTSPEDVLDCLCEQLDPSHLRGGNLKNLEPQFRGLMARPPKKPTVVVLDAVDELNPPDQLRTLLPRQLPPGLVLVFSGRSQGDRSCLSDIALHPADLGLHLRLDGLGESALVELLRMAGDAAPPLAEDGDFVGEMLRISAGDPFYLRFLVEDAASGLLRRDNIERTPTGLDAYLDQQLKQLSHSARRTEHVQILSLLLEAGTLTGRDLQATVKGLEWVHFDVIMREIHRFLLVHHRAAPGAERRGGDEEYSFCHDRFRQYFRARDWVSQ